MTYTSSMPQEAPPDSIRAIDSLPDSLLDRSNILSNQTDTGLQTMVGSWQEVGSHFFKGLLDVTVNFIPKLLSACFVLFLLYVLYRFSRKLLAQLLNRSKFIEAGLGGLLAKTYGVAAWIFIGIMVLAQFDINVTALLAGLSIVGIAVGLAAQDTLQNFISGITILTDRPFRVGHYIDIDGTYGMVEEITLRSTRLRTINNQMMVLPNAQMINQKLTNHTQLGYLRVEISFGVAYKEYPKEARKVVLKLTESDERLHQDRPPDVVVTELNNSSVDMQLRFYIKDSSLAFPIRREYTEKIREALREANIEIPFPHLQLFIDEANAFKDAPFLQSNTQKIGTRKPTT